MGRVSQDDSCFRFRVTATPRPATGGLLLWTKAVGRDTGQAMSQRNVELAQQAFDAFNRRDMGAFLALMDADVEAESRLVAMEGGYHGHDGIRHWWQNLLDAFPDFTLETVGAREHGNLTLATLRSRGHGADSDTPFVDTVWVVVDWRDEKAIRWRILSTDAEALEAVGLRE
jgi:ketosteroid isomerase-like protein